MAPKDEKIIGKNRKKSLQQYGDHSPQPAPNTQPPEVLDRRDWLCRGVSTIGDLENANSVVENNPK